MRADDGFTAFVDVTLLSMQPGDDAPRPAHTVLVRGARIVDIGPSDTLTLPEGTRVIDGAGRWLVPGLSDAHVHVWTEDELLLYLANGITTVRNMWGTPVQLGFRARIADGTLVGPQILTSGPILDGPEPIWNNSSVIDTPAQARDAVATQKAAGFDFLKVYDRVPAEAYAALVEAAREHGLPVCGHVPHAVGLQGVLAAGQLSVEHLTGMDAWFTPEALDDAAGLDALAADLIAAGTWTCPTLVVFTKFVAAETSRAWFERPEMAFVAPGTKASWEPSADFRLRDKTAADFARIAAGHARRRTLVKALHDRGAPLLLGTDAPNPFVVPGFSIHEELAFLVEAGLTPGQALHIATHNLAVAHGREHEFGSIAPGLRADLLLLDADPLQSVDALQQRAGVMADGRWYAEAELQARLAELALRYASPPDFLDGFPELPDLGGDDARYEVRANDALIAVERVVSDAASRQHRVQLGYDPSWGVAFEIGQTRGDGAAERVELRAQLGPLTGRAEFVRSGGVLRAHGEGSYAALAVERSLPDTTFLAFPSLGTESRLHERIMQLEVGEQLEVERVSVELGAVLEVKDTHLQIERLADAEIETGLGPRRAAVFAFDSHAVDGTGSVRSSVWIDAQTGRALGLEQNEQLATIRALRTE